MPVQNADEPFARLTAEEAKAKIAGGNVQFIDVREPNEYAAGHAAGAKLIPLSSVTGRIDEIAPDQDVVFICQRGQRSALAAEYAAAAGRTRLFNLEGGTEAWGKLGFPLEQ